MTSFRSANSKKHNYRSVDIIWTKVNGPQFGLKIQLSYNGQRPTSFGKNARTFNSRAKKLLIIIFYHLKITILV